MAEWFASHDGNEQMFLLCALAGGTVLILRLILHAGIDGHDGDAHAAHVSSARGFQILTIQGISSFFAMFGVVGYTLYHNARLGMFIALAGAVISGVAAVWIVQRIFVGMLRLQSAKK